MSTKDAKLNRAMEEIEKMKIQLKEEKANELNKNEGIKRDMDRVMEEDRKLERQKNELL